MGTRSPNIPNYHERSIIEAIRHSRPVPDRPKTIKTMLKKGWLERHDNGYRATQAGIDAIKLKIPDGK